MNIPIRTIDAMTEPHSLIHKSNIMEMCDIAREAPPGVFVEVGVYQGGSAYYLNQVAVEQGRSLYLFDTFEGIPEFTKGIDSHVVGDFADTNMDEVQALIPKAIIIKGVFPDSLPTDIPSVAFAHIDCDNYQSIRACIQQLGPHMVENGIMYFDDYNALKSATKAVDELLPGRTVLKNHKAMFVFHGESV